MRTWQKAVWATLALAWGLTVNALANKVQVDLTVVEPVGVARENEWVATGVPFAQGVLKDASALRIAADGKPIASRQFRTLNAWPDGSVKWALGVFPLSVPANGSVKLALTDGPAAPSKGGLTVQDGPDAIVVDTGVLQARIDKQAFRILSEVTLRGRRLMQQGDGGGAILELTDGQKLNMAAHPPEKVEIAESGPVRALIMARGRFPGAFVRDEQELIRWSCQIYFYAGSDQVRIHYTVGNDGAYTSHRARRENFQFKSLKLHFDTMPGAGVQVVTAEAEGGVADGTAFAIRQKGGRQGQADNFEAQLGDKTLVSSETRSSGALGVTGTGGAFSVALRDYWQNYPKETAVAHNRLTLALWPEWAGFPEGRDVYHLIGGKQKTHEIAFRFGAGDLASATALAAQMNRPLLPLAAPEYYADSGAITLLSPADVRTGDAETDAMIQRYDDLQRSKPAGLTQAAESRRRGNYYGWMNWGDLFWAWGSSSLHYDWTHIMLVHTLRTGQREAFDWGSAMARHQYDIDMHRSPRDRTASRFLSAYEKEERGGSGWHVSTNPGRMRPTPSHTWIQGQTLYAVLTGDPESWECARLGAEGLRSRMFAAHGLDKKPRRLQARTSGWSIEGLVAVYALTGEQDYLDDSRKIFENGLWHMFVEDGKSVLKWGGVQTVYCVRPLIDYHWHTGDERALEILKAMVDQTAEWSESFEYFMFGDAAAYVYYRTGDEAYLKQARVFLADLLKKRGTFNPRSGAWTKSEAKTSRSAYKHIAIERLKTLGRAPVGQ